MKRLFISQPMRDKTDEEDEEILAERGTAVRVAKEMLNEDVEVIDSYEERSITLTNREWSNVETYLMFTEGFFAQMIEVWEEFAQKKDSDGNLENPVMVKEFELLKNANQSAWKLLSEI